MELKNTPQITRLSRILPVIGLVLIIGIFFWDIGNILAPRQGTESLYVQISKEMFEASSWLQPLYRGEAHWSKPPLQYWIPMPIYGLFGGFSLSIARISMGILSLGCLFGLINFFKRQHIKIDYLPLIMIFLSSMGILKFSRIFMMEIPLTIFPFLGALYFYQYMAEKKLFDLFLASILIGLGALVKGPVSLAMGFGSLGIFYVCEIFLKNKIKISHFILVSVLSTFVASIWYLLCYQKYGEEFINYFFLRENMGKFGKEKMSSLKIIQGLLIYLIPWLHLIPNTLTKIKNEFGRNKLIRYFFIHFVVFFGIWFIPSQKSHHYAMPGFIFFLALMILLNIREKTSNISKTLFAIQLIIFNCVGIMSFYFAQTMGELFISLIVLGLLAASVVKIKYRHFYYGMGFMMTFIILPNRFYLPLVPSGEIERYLENTTANIFYNDRRPFFLEERLNRKIFVFNADKLKKGDLVLTPVEKIQNLNSIHTAKLFSWDKWKRKVSNQELWSAIQNRDLQVLKSKYELHQVK